MIKSTAELPRLRISYTLTVSSNFLTVTYLKLLLCLCVVDGNLFGASISLLKLLVLAVL